MISFVNFARIASIYVVFHLGTLHGYFFHQDVWPNLNFPLEYKIKRVLMSKCHFSEPFVYSTSKVCVRAIRKAIPAFKRRVKPFLLLSICNKYLTVLLVKISTKIHTGFSTWC